LAPSAGSEPVGVGDLVRVAIGSALDVTHAAELVADVACGERASFGDGGQLVLQEGACGGCGRAIRRVGALRDDLAVAARAEPVEQSPVDDPGQLCLSLASCSRFRLPLAGEVSGGS
jgi:hypothetical protein